jgi:pyruvate/2-oxoglutarate dehydrogenase complex dihydrolipoamide acyltransferase (E2) component
MAPIGANNRPGDDMSDPTAAFTKMVPGFEFLQSLVKNAGAALPSVGQWIAPTLNPEELEKRIEELRTVQFWLEQNARMLAATIQALEVQRMTLSTLKTMNVSVGELRDSLTLRMPETPAGSAPPAAGAAKADEASGPRAKPKAKTPKTAASPAPTNGGTAAAPAGVVDPMQWWSALTKQFTQLAAHAMKDTATDAAKDLAGSVAQQSIDAAGKTLKRAASVPAAVAKTAAAAAQRTAEGVTRRRPAKRGSGRR